MGILFTKLWRLFNHQGKHDAVAFIIKMSKIGERSGFRGPTVNDRSAALILALDTANIHMTL